MHWDVYEPMWFKLGVMIATAELSDASVGDHDLDSRSQEWKKAKISATVISQSFQSLWMEFGKLLRLVSFMNLVLSLSHSISTQGRETCSCDLDIPAFPCVTLTSICIQGKLDAVQVIVFFIEVCSAITV